MATSIQEQLAENLKKLFPDAQIKKINKDNFLDIHIPTVNPKKSTHLFFNTAKGIIKIGFYCREKDVIDEVLIRTQTLEAYSQGLRPLGNSEFNTVAEAVSAAASMLNAIINKKDQATGDKRGSSKEEYTVNESKEDKKQSKSKSPSSSKTVDNDPNDGTTKEKKTKAVKKNSTSYCFDYPETFLTSIQLLRNYYLGLSNSSPRVRSAYEQLLQEYTTTAVIPRVADDTLRLIHEDGFGIPALLLSPMFEAEKIYDEEFETHVDYIKSFERFIKDILDLADETLVFDTIAFLIKLGNLLEEEESYSGSLSIQDRYFPVFLILKSSPNLDIKSLKSVLGAIDYQGADDLLLKASGNFNQLSADEKFALILYDFILVHENPGLDIKIADQLAARQIFETITQTKNSEQLIGGFEDNDSFEIFQFFNVYYQREGFHEFCLDRWKELVTEWNTLKLQLIIEAVKRDFHPLTYKLNPVLDSYLEIFGGVKTTNTSSSVSDANKEKQKREKGTSKKSKSRTVDTKTTSTNVLTVEIANQLLIESDPTGYLDASIFTSIEDAAAMVLAKYKGHVLYLDGLTSLSDKAAEALAKFKNEEIYLNGLTSLSENARLALAKYKGDITLNESLASSINAINEDEEIFGEIEFKKKETKNENLAYPNLILSSSEDDSQNDHKKEYLSNWQLESVIYANRLGITAYIPEWIDGINRACPIFNASELELINKIALDHKLIPVLNYAPEEFLQEVKRVWWIVPFCIWREDFASWIMLDKNGIYAAYPSDNDITPIYGWDSISDMDFDTAYEGDPNVNMLTIYGLEEGQFLTFSEFVNEEHGSYLSMVYTIYQIRKATIEASRGSSSWKEGAGGEGFQSFESPTDLLSEEIWLDDPSRPDPKYFA